MNIRSPGDFTLDFLQSVLPGVPKHIIEVGCGDGELASHLQAAGYTVTALDHDEDAVNAAQTRGVQAIYANWLTWQPQSADVVLFTRSLHHLDDVDLALQKASDCLAGGGMIFAEDFAFSDTSAATAQWLKDQAQTLLNELQQAPDPDSFVELILRADDPLPAWYGDHDHIHPAAVMEAAFARIDPDFSATPCPYLFRYLVTGFDLPPGRLCVRLLKAEQRAIECGNILPIGRRFVARL